MAQDEKFIKDMIDLINEPNTIFKEIFENKFGNLPEDLKNEIALMCKEFIEESKDDLETTLNKMFKKYDNKGEKIYLTQEEYKEIKEYRKNLDSYNIVVGEILDFEKQEDYSIFSIRKQIFTLENMLENLGNNLESINETIDSKENDLSVDR